MDCVCLRSASSVADSSAVLQEAAQPGMAISFVARRHGIAPSLIFGWRRGMSEGGNYPQDLDVHDALGQHFFEPGVLGLKSA